MHDLETYDFYKTMTINTDPGEYADLFDDCPDDLESLCELIKCQLIHPGMIKEYANKLSIHTTREDKLFNSVEDMLAALYERNPEGLTFDREPDERLVLSCRFHALLLTSILRFKGIPCRCRAGFAKYLSENMKYPDHWICEVWNDLEKRWVFVDTDLKKIDISDDEFLTGSAAWLAVRNNEINHRLFGIKKHWGLSYIRNNLIFDFNCVLGRELRYHEFPPLSLKNIDRLSFDEFQLLDEIAYYLQQPDNNFEVLQKFYDTYGDLRY